MRALICEGITRTDESYICNEGQSPVYAQLPTSFCDMSRAPVKTQYLNQSIFVLILSLRVESSTSLFLIKYVKSCMQGNGKS